ncbi:MAG: toll/interleukin-1 receptor domain-containing protein [Saprospiraceae bacterium]|nr:toll/interleukin-1 receptor domain-containing protein [Saprospiraceae bacterium]
MKEKIRQLISDDQLAEALQLLEPYNPNEVLGLRGRLARIEKQNRSGLIPFDEYSRQQNQITAAALDILKKVPDGAAPTPSSGTGTGSTSPVSRPNPASAESQAIYFSYAWGDDNETGESREEIVNQLYDSLKADGFTLKRDKMDLEYRGLISEFMKDIGRSGLIVVAVSDKYLRSPYCMHELFEIYRNGRQEKEEFSKRVFPIRAESIKMSDPMVLDDYLDYWEKQELKWKDLVVRRADQLGNAHFAEYNKVKEINANFAQLLAFLQDMNAMSKRLLAQEDFAPVKDAIRKRLAELAG